MNHTSLLVSSFVSMGMVVLLSMNLMGIQESIRMEREEDDQLLLRVGVSEKNISRINWSVLILRMLLSILALTIIFILVYPRFFTDILKSFGLFSMPGSITPAFIGMLGISSISLVLLYLMTSKIDKFNDL